jgi:hypothetical protein
MIQLLATTLSFKTPIIKAITGIMGEPAGTPITANFPYKMRSLMHCIDVAEAYVKCYFETLILTKYILELSITVPQYSCELVTDPTLMQKAKAVRLLK